MRFASIASWKVASSPSKDHGPVVVAIARLDSSARDGNRSRSEAIRQAIDELNRVRRYGNGGNHADHAAWLDAVETRARRGLFKPHERDSARGDGGGLEQTRR